MKQFHLALLFASLIASTNSFSSQNSCDKCKDSVEEWKENMLAVALIIPNKYNRNDIEEQYNKALQQCTKQEEDKKKAEETAGRHGGLPMMGNAWN